MYVLLYNLISTQSVWINHLTFFFFVCLFVFFAWILQYLDRIGQVFFGVPPKQSPSYGGLLGEWSKTRLFWFFVILLNFGCLFKLEKLHFQLILTCRLTSKSLFACSTVTNWSSRILQRAFIELLWRPTNIQFFILSVYEHVCWMCILSLNCIQLPYQSDSRSECGHVRKVCPVLPQLCVNQALLDILNNF